MRPSLRSLTSGCLSLGLALSACTPGSLDDVLGQRRSAALGQDGAQTIAAINQPVNTYGPLATNANKGSTSITVSMMNNLGVLQPGDLLMLIQMQGATIDTIDGDTYGSILDTNGAGLYELIGLTAVSGNDLTLDGSCGGLRNSYLAAGRTQVIRVPQYTTLSIPNGTSVSAPAWDGSSGGVVAIFAQNSVSFSGNGTIDVSGRGFRGGGIDGSSGSGAGTLIYRSAATADGGEKGEGIAGPFSNLLNGGFGRGAPANGGGGGNYGRAGGGGGGNGDSSQAWTGHGVMSNAVVGAAAWTLDPAYTANGNQNTSSAGGGRGGYSSGAADQNALTTAPGSAGWGGDQRREVGGRGGRPLINVPHRLLFMGGGGGAGEGTVGSSSRGGAGGGIVLLFARDITGPGTILANGANGQAGATNEGGGGGGAGGTVVVAANRSFTGISIQANGGNGGGNPANGANSQGPGGGGSGGFIATVAGAAGRSANGGSSGSSSGPAVAEFPVNGATNGNSGQANVDATPTLGLQYPACFSADVQVAATAGQTVTLPGGQARFTASVKNLGPLLMNDIRLIEQQPLVLTSVTWTCTANGGATCPAASGSGNLPSVIDLPSGGELVFALSGLVPSGMGAGMLNYLLTAALPLGYTDPQLDNNVGSASSNVVAGSLIDLSIAVSTDPLEPAVGEDVTYIFDVNNKGPSSTSAASISFSLPAGAVLRGVLFADSWNCNIMNQLVTCLRQTPLLRDQASELRLTVTPPMGATSLRIVATVGATDNSESKPIDNTAVWDIPIGASMLYAAGGGLGCSLALTAAPAATKIGLALGLLALATLLRTARRSGRRQPATKVGR